MYICDALSGHFCLKPKRFVVWLSLAMAFAYASIVETRSFAGQYELEYRMILLAGYFDLGEVLTYANAVGWQTINAQVTITDFGQSEIQAAHDLEGGVRRSCRCYV